MTQEQSSPNFLYIGAAKAGSSWLFEVLREHPGIFVPVAKDLQFFDHHYDLGRDWYLAHFKAATPGQVRGEISHDYFLSERYAERIARHCPEVKLIVCLRDPVERAVSKLIYARSTTLKAEADVREFLFSDEILDEGRYLKNLAPFFDRFPKASILVFFFDEICNEPDALCRKLYGFLGVDPDFVPRQLNRKVREARVARHEGLAHLAWKAAKLLRKMGFANLVGRIKLSPFFNRLFYVQGAAETGINQSIIEDLKKELCRDFDALEGLLGFRLPKNWPKVGHDG